MYDIKGVYDIWRKKILYFWMCLFLYIYMNDIERCTLFSWSGFPPKPLNGIHSRNTFTVSFFGNDMSIKRVVLLYRLVRHLTMPSKSLVIYLTYRVIYLPKFNLVSNLYQIKRNCLSSISNILQLSVELELILVRLLNATDFFFSVWFKVSYWKFGCTLYMYQKMSCYTAIFTAILKQTWTIKKKLLKSIY